MIDGRGISCKIALRWMHADKSRLVQVIAWCRAIWTGRWISITLLGLIWWNGYFLLLQDKKRYHLEISFKNVEKVFFYRILSMMCIDVDFLFGWNIMDIIMTWIRLWKTCILDQLDNVFHLKCYICNFCYNRECFSISLLMHYCTPFDWNQY